MGAALGEMRSASTVPGGRAPAGGQPTRAGALEPTDAMVGCAVAPLRWRATPSSGADGRRRTRARLAAAQAALRPDDWCCPAARDVVIVCLAAPQEADLDAIGERLTRTGRVADSLPCRLATDVGACGGATPAGAARGGVRVAIGPWSRWGDVTPTGAPRIPDAGTRAGPAILPLPVTPAATPYGAGPPATGARAPLRERLLVLDALAGKVDRPTWVAQGTAALVASLGLPCDVRAVGLPEVLDGHDDALTLVLVHGMLPGTGSVAGDRSRGRHPDGEGRAGGVALWERPRELVGTLHRLGRRIWVVNAGGSAIAIAGCLAAGADAIILDGLAERLRTAFSQRSEAGDVRRRRRGPVERSLRGLMALTASERRVLFCLACGYAATDIAAELMVSVSTVRAHIRAILRKLDVRTQLAAVARANGVAGVD